MREQLEQARVKLRDTEEDLRNSGPSDIDERAFLIGLIGKYRRDVEWLERLVARAE